MLLLGDTGPGPQMGGRRMSAGAEFRPASRASVKEQRKRFDRREGESMWNTATEKYLMKNNEENEQIQIPRQLFYVYVRHVNTTLPLEFELQQPRQASLPLMHHLPINPSYAAIKQA